MAFVVRLTAAWWLILACASFSSVAAHRPQRHSRDLGDIQLDGRRARNLQIFVSGTVDAHLQATPIFAVNDDANQYSLVGNVSEAQFLDQSFVSKTNLSGVVTVPIYNGSWYQMPSFTEADCASFIVEANAPVDIFVITTAAFNLLVQQFAQHPGSISQSLIQAPNVAGGPSVWTGVSSMNFTVSLNRTQSYLLAILNVNAVPITATISMDVHTAANPECADYLEVQGIKANTTKAFQDLAVYSYLGKQSIDSYIGFTGASCIAYGIASRNGSQGNSNDLNLDTNIRSTGAIPVTTTGLNTSIFVVSANNLQNWGKSQFSNFTNFTTGGVCTITDAHPGPCFAVASNLDPKQTYTIWTAQGGSYTELLPTGQAAQYWTLQTASALNNNSCREIWPVTPSPPPPPVPVAPARPAPAPLPSAAPVASVPVLPSTPSPSLGGNSTTQSQPAPVQSSSGSSSSTGAIVGGAVGGVVGAALILLVAGLLWRRHSNKNSEKGHVPLIHHTGASFYSQSTARDSTDWKPRTMEMTSSTELEDFKAALSLSSAKTGTNTDSQTASGANMSRTRSAGSSHLQEFLDIEREFGLPGASLPAPGVDANSQGIKSIAEDAIADEQDDTVSTHSYLEETWIVKPEDLHCKMSNGTPILLGTGGFGSVYLGVLNRVREVAVKVVSSHSKKQQQRFIREIKTLKACLDPNIVQFLGVCVQGHQILMVMQYMPNGDLWSKLEHDVHGEYRWYNKGRNIAMDVAKGLVFLHSKKIAHLDLKTPNILLTNNDEAKISDVGLGKLIQGPCTTATQQGSFYWASPEQLLGNPTTTLSDMFSMGTVLWEICTGEQPRQRLLRKLRVPEEAPQEIADLIQRCLAFEPNDRPRAVELHDIIAHSATSARSR